MSPALRRAIETCDARHLHPANELLCAGKGGLAVYLPINGIGALEKPRLTLVTAIQGWVWPCSWPVHSYFRQRAVERKRQPMNSEEAEQLAGRSRSRLPPFGRRYAKPPAAALLTGQVARELASTLKRLRLVRSFHLPWPRRASCCTQFITALRESRFTALRLYQAWALTSPSRQHAGSRFLGSGHVDQIGAKIGTPRDVEGAASKLVRRPSPLTA